MGRNRLRALDAFPKIQDDFYSQTLSGGVITIASSVVMTFLFLTELGRYLSTQTVHQLEVDTSRGAKIAVNVDITFPRMPCEWVSVDAMDVSGRVQLSVDHDMFRERLSSRGTPIERSLEQHRVGPSNETLPDHLHPDVPGLPDNYCGSCYGAEAAEGACCNTCDAVRDAYREKGWVMPPYDSVEQCKREGFQDSILQVKNEGCRLWGELHVAKVAGHIQFAPGKSYQHMGQLVHDLQPFRNVKLDVSHSISVLSFGEAYPGQSNPLSGASFDQRAAPGNPKRQTGMYQYYLKVVPTSYTDLHNRTTQSNQYSVTEHFRPMDAAMLPMGGGAPPGVFLFYDLSAIKVNVVEQQTSFLHFVTNVCAIVGGVFTVSGLLDSGLYHGHKLIRKKIEIGKFG